MSRVIAAFVLLGVVVFGVSLRGEEAAQQRSAPQAVEAALAIVQKALRSYPEHRKCFSCHHQTLPMLAMTEAEGAGYEIDRPLLAEATEFTHDFFTGRKKQLLSGKNVGGSALTVSYGLWTLSLGEQPVDKTSQAMVSYLLQTQRDDGSWRRPSFRPPMSDSDITCTVIAAYYLPLLAVDSQREEVDQAVARALAWTEKSPVETQEDKNLRLWGLSLLGAKEKSIDAARQAVLSSQRSDGGWAQLDDMESDAYATGQALFVLQQTGFKVDGEAYQRGVAYLLKTQQDDGSWFVETRAKPVQTFFDNGDPHGKSQFLSVAATGWAVAALAHVPRPAVD